MPLLLKTSAVNELPDRNLPEIHANLLLAVKAEIEIREDLFPQKFHVLIWLKKNLRHRFPELKFNYSSVNLLKLIHNSSSLNKEKS